MEVSNQTLREIRTDLSDLVLNGLPGESNASIRSALRSVLRRLPSPMDPESDD